jgi:hypothetical protein
MQSVRPPSSLLWIAVLLLSLGAATTLAQPVDAARESAVKAAYLVNFLRYTQWPESRTPFTVTVVGDDAVADALEADSREPSVVAGGGLVVHRVRFPRPGSDGALGSGQRARFAEMLQQSHLVFIGRDDVDRREDILALVRATPVLTVSDGEGFADEGGMFELVTVGRRIAFEANPGAIEAGGLLVSAKVLKLARDLHGVRR